MENEMQESSKLHHVIDKITIEEVKDKYEKLVETGQHILVEEEQCAELITILGGMDQVLKRALVSNNPYDLTQMQLKQISNVLSTKSGTQKVKVYTNQLTSFSQEDVEAGSGLESDAPPQTPRTTSDTLLYIQKSDTLLHRLSNENTSNYVIEHLFGKFVSIFFILLVLMTVTLSIIARSLSGGQSGVWDFWFYFAGIIILFYSVLLLFTVNRTVAKKAMQKFDFWVKCLYAFRLAVSATISSNTPGNFRDILANLIFLQTVIAYSLVDGLQMPYKLKVSIGVVMSLYFSFFAAMYTIFWGARDLYILSILSIFEINVTALVTSSYRILALFLIKQTYKLIFAKDKSTSLTKSIAIKWVD